jgi:hypothetical protein
MSYPYQNQPGYPPQYPPPYPPQYPPPKKNNGLVIGLAVVALLAVAGLVVVLVVTGGDDKPSNTPAAGSGAGDSTGSSAALGQKVAQIIQNHDTDTAKQLLCNADSAKFIRSLQSLDKTDVTATYNGVKETGDTAEATITMAVAGNAPRDQKIKLSRKNDRWCID